jgi:hypothetical protein
VASSERQGRACFVRARVDVLLWLSCGQQLCPAGSAGAQEPPPEFQAHPSWATGLPLGRARGSLGLGEPCERAVQDIERGVVRVPGRDRAQCDGSPGGQADIGPRIVSANRRVHIARGDAGYRVDLRETKMSSAMRPGRQGARGLATALIIIAGLSMAVPTIAASGALGAGSDARDVPHLAVLGGNLPSGTSCAVGART